MFIVDKIHIICTLFSLLWLGFDCVSVPKLDKSSWVKPPKLALGQIGRAMEMSAMLLH